MGAVVDVRITSASRWSVKGEVIAWMSSRPIIADTALQRLSETSSVAASNSQGSSGQRRPDAQELHSETVQAQSGSSAVSDVSSSSDANPPGQRQASSLVMDGWPAAQAPCSGGPANLASAVQRDHSAACNMSQQQQSDLPRPADARATSISVEHSHGGSDADISSSGGCSAFSDQDAATCPGSDLAESKADASDETEALFWEMPADTAVSSPRNAAELAYGRRKQQNPDALDCILYAGVLLGLLGVLANAAWTVLISWQPT